MSGLRKKGSTAVVLAILLCAAALAAPGISFGAGLGIDPGEINVKNVPPGEKVAVSALGGEGMKLKIKNQGADACNYTIDILPCAKTTATLGAGYIDIPDVSWISPEAKEVQVPGNSSKDVELYIKVPEEKERYGKSYQAVIEVKSKGKGNKSGVNFVLACQMKICFSTVNLDAGEAKHEDK